MEKNNVITVTKTVTEKCAANLVRISITVRGENKKYSAAIAEAEERSAKVSASLGEFEVRGGGISVGTVTDEKKNTVYRASRTFSTEFAFDAEKLEHAVDKLCDSDVNWNVAFVFFDDVKRKTLLDSAVRAARCDAETIASAAGVKLGALYCVDYASDSNRPMLMRAAAFGAEPEELSVSETVTCSWSIDR